MKRLAGPLLLAVFLTACGVGTVNVPAPNPDPSAARLCNALRARLPARLHGKGRRSTTPKSSFVTAWGSPAIALRCGVGRPAGLQATTEVTQISGISWFPQPPDNPVTFTAVNLAAYVEVDIPAAYSPAGDVLTDLIPAIKATIPLAPSGQD